MNSIPRLLLVRATLHGILGTIMNPGGSPLPISILLLLLPKLLRQNVRQCRLADLLQVISYARVRKQNPPWMR